MRFSCKKLCTATLAHFPVIIAVLWMVYTLSYEYIRRIPVAIVDLVEVLCGFVIIGLFSWRYNFCLLHKMLIVYAWLCSLCMFYEEHYGFEEWLSLAHNIASGIGVCLLSALIIQQMSKVRCQEEKK